MVPLLAVLIALSGCPRRQQEAPEQEIDPNLLLLSYEAGTVTAAEFIAGCRELLSREELLISTVSETSWAVRTVEHLMEDEILADLAREEGLQEEKVIENWRDFTRRQEVIENFLQDAIFRQVDVTDDDIAREYEFQKDRFLIPTNFRFNQIWIDIKTWGREQAARRASEAFAQLQAGEKFNAVIVEFSDRDPLQRFKPLGPYKEGELPYKELERAALNTPSGEFSEIIETPLGFHIVMPDKVQKEKTQTLESVSDQLAEEIFLEKVRERTQDFFRRLNKKWNVKQRLEILTNPVANESAAVLEVGDRRVTLKEFRHATEKQRQQGKSETELLKTMSRRFVAYEEAVEQGYDKSPRLEEDMRVYENGTLAKCYLEKHAAERATVTDEEIDRYYEEEPASLYAEKEIEASQIYIKAALRDDMMHYERMLAMDDAEALCYQVRYEVCQGLPFAHAAGIYSDVPTGAEGGNMGRLRMGTSRRLDNVAFFLQEGQISNPIEMDDGFQLVWVQRIHDSYLPEKEQVRDKIVENIINGKKRQYVVSKMQEIREQHQPRIHKQALDQVSRAVRRKADSPETWSKF